jgi:translocator protein
MTAVTAARCPLRELKALASSLTLCAAVAGLGGYWTSLGLGPWYESLRKPFWTPPGWIFAPVWTALYASMAVAAWLVWWESVRVEVRLPLSLYGLQLALNLAWTGIFFALRRPGLAFGEIVLLWTTILVTLMVFGRVSRSAAGFLAPYLVWVTFAAALNFAIWRLNP